MSPVCTYAADWCEVAEHAGEAVGEAPHPAVFAAELTTLLIAAMVATAAAHPWTGSPIRAAPPVATPTRWSRR